MEKPFPLSELKVGQRATVAALLTSGAMRRRLQDLGIISGTRVLCAFGSPSGDPMAYEVRGSLVAIRRNDAKTILIN